MKSRSVGLDGHENGDKVCIVGSGFVVGIEVAVPQSARFGRLLWSKSCSTADLRRLMVEEVWDFHLRENIRDIDRTTTNDRRRLTAHLHP